MVNLESYDKYGISPGTLRVEAAVNKNTVVMQERMLESASQTAGQIAQVYDRSLSSLQSQRCTAFSAMYGQFENPNETQGIMFNSMLDHLAYEPRRRQITASAVEIAAGAHLAAAYGGYSTDLYYWTVV